MSVAAAKAFAEAVKKTKAQHDKFQNETYKAFIAGSKTPTKEDVKKFAQFVKETEEIAHAWQTIAVQATLGFGGAQDSVIHADKIMLQTLMKKAG